MKSYHQSKDESKEPTNIETSKCYKKIITKKLRIDAKLVKLFNIHRTIISCTSLDTIPILMDNKQSFAFIISFP